MADLIDRQAVKDTIKKRLGTLDLFESKFNADIDKIPAVGAAEVIRCKECKHEETCMKQLVFWERDHVLEQNVYQYHTLSFCSYGERKDNATD